MLYFPLCLCDGSNINEYTALPDKDGKRIPFNCETINRPAGTCMGGVVIKCIHSIHLQPFQTEFAHKGHNYHQCKYKYPTVGNIYHSRSSKLPAWPLQRR